MDNPSSAQYWDDRYLQDATSWDMGEVSPPLKAYFDQLTNKNLSILIPGCGNGYEAGYLLEKGFSSVTLIDISPVLTARLQEKFRQYAGPPPAIVTGDFFQWQGAYDLVIEQTFFCALDPALREGYVKKMHSLLKPGGKLAGLLFDREFKGGPPFGGNKEEYRRLLEKEFEIKTLDACYNSIAPRAGTELFVLAKRM